MTQKSITDIMAAIVAELTPLQSEERQRVIQASLVLLGESPLAASKKSTAGLSDADDSSEMPARARTWIKHNNLSLDHIQQVFHVGSDGVEIIISEIPGKGNRDKVRNAYVLLGVARLISSNDPRFDDKDARALCERYGFFDGTNHMKYMKGGNEFTGSKEKGWILTAPGLKHGAALILDLTK
ncbi:hypothetical protein [Bradyrhizobium sp. LMTR 3]|uniref:hypothetical protein n=1 Tax=Bradyrhizobium sp. LMTR 3 TaxID=189873 RepID=UPI000810EE87|nr:hypothetical protein [Bradyrhizobium sp. LMTR 3]OCK58057.1 hypothetical protein LMTR3_03015 [Bradyrhizobium sp. LMTR 3]